MELPEHIRRKVAELRRRYVAETTMRVDALVELVEAGDGSLQVVREAMHDLQGNGATFGFPSITRIAEDADSYLRVIERLDVTAAGVLRRHLRAIRDILDGAEDRDGRGPGESAVNPLPAAF